MWHYKPDYFLHAKGSEKPFATITMELNSHNYKADHVKSVLHAIMWMRWIYHLANETEKTALVERLCMLCIWLPMDPDPKSKWHRNDTNTYHSRVTVLTLQRNQAGEITVLAMRKTFSGLNGKAELAALACNVLHRNRGLFGSSLLVRFSKAATEMESCLKDCLALFKQPVSRNLPSSGNKRPAADNDDQSKKRNRTAPGGGDHEGGTCNRGSSHGGGGKGGSGSKVGKKGKQRCQQTDGFSFTKSSPPTRCGC
ncbi:hypothetical protein PM082_010134 [Marasmius tenuissimus]|nr:hypothetical protein PM082_010134 [Marasmius tenuissimus]